MNPTDHWDDLKTAGTVPPPSPEVLAHATRQLDQPRRTRRRRVLVPVLAAAGTAAVVITAVALYQPSSTTVPAAGPSPAPRSPVSGTPTGTPSHGVAASCVEGYSPANLKKRAFAFDGTVQKIVPQSGGALPSYLVTFQVHEWFRPSGAVTATVRTYNPPDGSNYQVSTEFPGYTVGTRLLITGEPQWGGADPLKDAIAWGCGFSRPYTEAAAATWREILKK